MTKAARIEEKVFSKLPDLGYSQETTNLIWLWYNPKEKCSTDILK
jgi:hypothetical protein